MPLGHTPSTHILKVEPPHFPGLIINEFFCMTLARRVGLRVPDVAIREAGASRCLLVARHDRERLVATGGVRRVHQEDFCQAIGRVPERKYQQEGGPTVRECVSLLREWSTAPVLDLIAFVDGLIFNLLIGNANAHGKNFSMLYTPGERRMAPLYDLVATVTWPEISTRLAMSIGDGARSGIRTYKASHGDRSTPHRHQTWLTRGCARWIAAAVGYYGALGPWATPSG